ncbi:MULTISPECIES: MalY/PatB family protein [Marinitoga]|uniref:MalY/PatB family protein n=1 Tax=Marinitoga TaxID=160798 RepID=UPI0013EADF85|nr:MULTISPECIES: PatB family C-S lyase [Marinitoga]KAF2955111.1 cystathionine beta-lyase [Marinitoga sp. 38H-ov]MBM7558854.1 cystathionine beta-lyase [Marinitoga litoralis]
MKYVDRRGTYSVKWDWYEWNKNLFLDKDVLPMWVADMDFEAPEKVIKVLKERIEHGAYGYTFRPRKLKENIVSWLEYKHNWKVDKNWILSTHGVIPALNFSIQLYTNPGDKILIQTPVYPPFMSSVKNNNRELVINELVLKDNRYEIDFDDFEEKLKESKMFILCSPHNPIGRVWSKEELERIGKLCLKHDVLIISDEIHADLTFENVNHTPIASISDDIAQNTITLMAPSKTFNIAGLHYSYTIIKNTELRKIFKKWIIQSGLYGHNLTSIIAANAAYKYGKNWLNKTMEYIEENYYYVKEYFEKNIPEVKVIKSEGTFLVWLDFRQLNLSQNELRELLEKKAKVGLNSGDTFGPGGKGFMRMNIATSRENIEETCKRIKNALR